jgi:hypothetical protein
MFFCYYVKGMTLEEIADAACCSFQNIGVTIKKIEGRLYLAWKDKETWRKNHDGEHGAASDLRRDKERSK